ncbi:MAG: hypothetical protein IID46_04320 [Planctomycetes bacterium]|nr:hypothetical protein [Planctomycetota bacterium]
MKTLIQGATVILPEGAAKTNVLIDGEKIADVDPAVQTTADEVVDAAGLQTHEFAKLPYKKRTPKIFPVELH